MGLVETFHFELTTIFLQPLPLVCVFFGDRLWLLLARGALTIVEAMNESKGISSDQQTDLIAETVPQCHFERVLPRIGSGEVSRPLKKENLTVVRFEFGVIFQGSFETTA